MTLPTTEDRAAGRAPISLLIFLALITSVTAMTIDAILPALDAISDDLGFADPSDRQLIVLVVFAGLGLGQPVFGPLSDAIGRRRTAAIGWAIYIAGTLIAMVAPGLWTVLLGRFLQGIGAGGPRVVATAIVRDLYEGRAMARMVSMIMTVFMAVPMLAPLIGQGLEALGGWRAIFLLYLAMALGCAAWHLTVIPETLAPENKRPLSFAPLAAAFGEVLRTRTTMLYTLASAAIFGTFAAFLASAQQVYEEIFALGPLFPLVFAAMAGIFAVSQFANSRMVMTLGMRPLCRIAGWMVLAGSLTALGLSGFAYGWAPPLLVFLGCMVPVFIGSAWMFSNLTALALEPLGHIAGTASAVVMSVSTLLAAPVGALIARQIDGTVVPLLLGFAGLGGLSLALIVLADRARSDL